MLTVNKILMNIFRGIVLKLTFYGIKFNKKTSDNFSSFHLLYCGRLHIWNQPGSCKQTMSRQL